MKFDITYSAENHIQGIIRGTKLEFVTDDLNKIEEYKEIFDYFSGEECTIFLKGEPRVSFMAPEDIYYIEVPWEIVKRNIERARRECIPGAKALDDEWCVKDNIFYHYTADEKLKEYLTSLHEKIVSFGHPIAGRIIPDEVFELLFDEFAFHSKDKSIYIYEKAGFDDVLNMISTIDVAEQFFGHYSEKIKEVENMDPPLPVIISFDCTGFSICPRLVDGGIEFPNIFEKGKKLWIDCTCDVYDASTKKKLGKIVTDRYGKPVLIE